VRAVDHAAGNGLLFLEIMLVLFRSGHLREFLEVNIGAECERVEKGVHVEEGVSVGSTLSMDRTGSNEALLGLVVGVVLEEALVVNAGHFLVLVHHVLHHSAFTLTPIHLSRPFVQELFRDLGLVHLFG
jgi:hypothetical protein